jgi:predicted MPP superfamily phosphohydrolase
LKPLIDPRLGDAEDDASSTKSRSLWSIGGTLLAEVSLPKLVLSWVMLIALPALLLGVGPLVATAWLRTISDKVAVLAGLGSLLLLLLVAVAGWIIGRPLYRMAERGFWSLNALAVQPGYALCREGLRHLIERLMKNPDVARRSRLRAVAAAGGGLFVSATSVLLMVIAWPFTHWVGEAADLISPHRLVIPSLANGILLVAVYVAVVALVWGTADATMDQPADLDVFDLPPDGGRVWRVAHLSDLHFVGGRYGFRIESGRMGPQGNDRAEHTMTTLERVHAARPVDIILVTGDMTDAGSSAEWVEFFDLMARFPTLAERMLILPGNHDINVVDRANPARLDLPFSSGKQLRRLRTLSAITAVQGNRVRLVDASANGRLGSALSDVVSSHRDTITAFANSGALRLTLEISDVWADCFPMVLPPDGEDGLGVVLLNSNAESHFSFTNALGLVSTEQAACIATLDQQFPRAHWIVALHHHLVEYPAPAKAFSERIGTALINGSWFSRQLQAFASRLVVMHGHRHIDWIGTCGKLRIVSAPSIVREAAGDDAHFHIHTLATGPDGLYLLAPEKVEVSKARAEETASL